jgi:hypothetical protein
MLAFMLPVIPTEEKTGRNCIFVKYEDGKYIFYAGGEHCIKRVILNALVTTTDAAGDGKKPKKIPETFMIPRGIAKGFSEVLKDHKSQCKKLSKEDSDRVYVDVNGDTMQSIKEYVHFEKPDFQFKDLQPFFEQKKTPGGVPESIIMPGGIEAIMTGFSKTKQVTAIYCTMPTDEGEVSLIHYKQKETEYEAVFVCPSEELEPEKDENEQTEI